MQPPTDTEAGCLFVYGRMSGGITGRICGKAESDHCSELYYECMCHQPHHPFHRRAGRRCEDCSRPIEPYYNRCRACHYKAKAAIAAEQDASRESAGEEDQLLPV